MNKTYFVTQECPCATCEGAGSVRPPPWVDFYREHPDGGQSLSDYEFDRWFSVRGYSKPPPEEGLCPDCEGSGVCVTRTNLLDALHDLGVLSSCEMPPQAGDEVMNGCGNC